MGKVYASLVEKGLKTVEEVPLAIRDAVIAELATRGWTPPIEEGV